MIAILILNIMQQVYQQIRYCNFIAEKIPIGGSIINNEVPILLFNEPNKPNIVSKGTIKISAPEPTSPAKTPVTSPVNVNPKILFINIILEIF